MNHLVLIVGLGLFCFLLLYIFNSLKENNLEQNILKLILLVFVIGLLILIPKIALDSNTVCELVLDNTQDVYQYGNNFTGYHWDYDTGTAPDGPQLDAYIFHINRTNTYIEQCYTINGNTGNIFYIAVLWFIRVLAIFIFIYLSYLGINLFIDKMGLRKK